MNIERNNPEDFNVNMHTSVSFEEYFEDPESQNLKQGQNLGYIKLPLSRYPPPDEELEKASVILSYLKKEFIPTWQRKHNATVELRTRFDGDKVIIIFGVADKYISDCRAIMEGKFGDSSVQVLVEREELPYVRKLDFELKRWWRFW